MINSENIHNNTSKQMPASVNQTLIAQFSSPLPPPELLIAYEKAQPGLIEKIIKMTERESNHRRELEKLKQDAEIGTLQRGDVLISRAQIFAFIISVVTILSGCATAIKGAQVAGSIISLSGLASIIVAFLKNSKRENS